MRVLVTGANGFVGGHLLSVLACHDLEVVAVSREDLDVCDASDVDSLVRSARPERVFHLAAQASVALSFREPVRTFQINALGTLNLLEAMRTHVPDARLLVASSADTYGHVEPHEIPVHEDVPQRPVSPYAASKVAQESVALQYARAYGMHVVVTRSFNAIGPGQSTDFALPSFAAQIARGAARGKGIRLQVGNLDVERDFVDVRDVVRAQVMLLESSAPGQCFNICSGSPVRLSDALDVLIAESGQSVIVEVDPELLRPTDVPRMAGDNRKICATVPWSATIPLSQSLRDLYQASLAAASSDASTD
jgi:GDP-4-dehydro-6-deoxy-D-mannose reductase